MTKKNDAPAKSSKARLTPKAVETRARIIRGALDCVEQHGIHASTTRRIAESAGINLATLHYHFENKDELLLAVLDVLVADMTQYVRSKVGPAETLDARIETLVKVIWAYAAQTYGKQIAQLELTLYALRTQGTGWVAGRQYSLYIDTYRQMLLDGVGRPETSDAAIAEAVARFILRGIDGLMLQVFALESTDTAGEGVDELVASAQVYLVGLLDRAGAVPVNSTAGMPVSPSR